MIMQCDGAEICTRASAALAASPIPELRKLRVDYDGDRLAVSGSVASFYHQQVALHTVRNVARGMQIENSVSVRPIRQAG